MPRTYADLLKEARAQIREVTPQEVDALPPGTAVVDVREDSEWDQGHLPGAVHISKSYVEQQIENAVPDRDVRERLIFEFEGASMGEVNAMGFRRDFVLRGRRQTPELD
jgi:rhodanese-related sulfurtransferase